MELGICSFEIRSLKKNEIGNFENLKLGKLNKLRVCDCDALISGGHIDNTSTHRISVLGYLAPKSWYRAGTNYLWTPSYSTPLSYVPSLGPIYSYLNMKYEKKMNNYSL